VDASGTPEGATELNCPNGLVRFTPENGQVADILKMSALCHLLPDAPQQTASSQAALWTFGDPKTRRRVVEALDDIDNRLAGAIDVAAQAVARIETLFANPSWKP
jgi:hypothetical protein